MFKVDSKRIISIIVMAAMITGIFSAINPTNVYAGAVSPITSTIYAIDQEKLIIGEVEEEKLTVDTFEKGINLPDGCSLSVYESDETTLKIGKIRNGDKVKVTKDTDDIVYTIDTYKYVDDFVQGEKTYVGNLVDIGAEKSYPNAAGDDGASDAINLGFDFSYFNNSYNKAYIDINAFLSFDESLKTNRNSTTFNSGDWSRWGFDGNGYNFNFIGAFIDDIMMTPNGSGYSPSIFCKTIGVEGHRKFIVQWTNMYFWSTPFQFGDVQVILFEDSDEIQVQYRRLFNNASSNRGFGAKASVGLKGTNNVVYRDLTKPEYADKLLSQGQAIRFKPNASGSYDIDDHAEYINVFLSNSGAPSVAYIDASNNATADKTVINSTEPVLRWSESTGVQKYKLIVSDDKQFSKIIYNIDNDLEKSFKFGSNYPLEYDKTYYWMVKSINSSGEVISSIYSFTIVKVDQLAPTGLAGVAPTVYDGYDGKITGITTGSAIEYKLSIDTIYIPASGTEITGLVSGTYYVRYAKTADLNAGLDATVVVPEGSNIKQPYTVTGSIKDENNAYVSSATVKIMAGSEQIALTTADNSGNFSINAIPNGTYNLVISKGTDQTITLSITVSNNDVAIGTVIFPNGKKNSVLEVTGDNTPEIVVDGLNKFFDSGKFSDDEENFVENGGKIEIKLSVEKRPDSDAKNAAEIRTLAGNTKTIGIFLDLTLNKTVTTGSAITTSSAITGTFPVEELDDALSIYIPLPTELQGKSDYVIYRYHGNGVDTITTTATPEGEKIVVSADLKSIMLYTKKFSTYAIAYTAATNNDKDDDDDNDNVPVIVSPDGGNKIIIKKDVEKATLPYYMHDGNKIFIGFTANSEDVLKYIAPNGETVKFEKNPKNFTDIENHWAKESVDFVTEREIFMGTDTNIFNPNISMTRAMFVAAVGRLYERSYGNVTGNATFSDVDTNAYYAKYVSWANENGIIKGIGGNKFAPDAEVTREQMSEIMFNFATFLGKAPQGDWMINVTYKDKVEISDWAMDSAAYCQLTSIITGRDGGDFAPKATATRAEVSAVIERFVKEVLK